MSNFDSLKRVLMLSFTALGLLTAQDIEPPTPSAELSLIAENAVRVITIGNDAYAMGVGANGPFRILLAKGVTKGYGVAKGRLAFRVDDDLFLLDLATGHRNQITLSSPVVNAAWSPDGNALAIALNTEAGVNLTVDALDGSPSALVYPNGIVPEVLRWTEDGTLVFATEDSPEQTMLRTRADNGMLSAKQVRREVLPLLAVATDADLLSVDPERSVARWDNTNGVPLAITDTGTWTFKSDTDEIEFRGIHGEPRLRESLKSFTAREVRAAIGIPSYGTLLGEYDGVASYSNGSASNVSNESNYINRIYIGMKWQCVEFIRRYYYTRFGLDLAAKFKGDAREWWDGAATMNLDRFSNGGTNPPEPGDILVSTGGTGNVGHVAIVRSRNGSSICTANQNLSNTTEQLNRCLTLTVSSGRYTVAGFSNSYPSTGWLRRKNVATAVKAEITNPIANSTLAGATQIFGWSAGQNITQYFLYVGTSLGMNDIYGASQGTNRSTTVGNLPTDGRTLFVRLWSFGNGSWLAADYQYRAAVVSQVSGAKAEMTSPVPGSPLTSATQTFAWNSGQNVAQYFFYVGTTVGANNLYGASTGTNKSVTVTNLPTDGRTLFVRLWSLVNGSWLAADYQYRAAVVSQVSGAKAEMTSPVPGSPLTSATQTFAWNSGQNVAQYFFYVGTTVGANNLYGASTGTNRSVTVTNLPTDGRMLYVRLWSLVNGSWQWADYQYRAATR